MIKIEKFITEEIKVISISDTTGQAKTNDIKKIYSSLIPKYNNIDHSMESGYFFLSNKTTTCSILLS